MTDELIVELAERAYPIYFNQAQEALKKQLSALRKGNRCIRVISDARVLDAHPYYLQKAGFTNNEILTFPAGEPTKSIQHYAEALSHLAQAKAGRDCTLFAFGGGVIGDLSGFVAASYLRGIDFYQIPTTLLAMVDSSVGGKTGINIPEGKNLVGAFWQPQAVFIDTSLLETLPPREFAAGMAEVIKYGMLADEALFTRLESIEVLNAKSSELSQIIRRCCAIKAEIVSADEKETATQGGRALLNLGHTFAHAIENVAGYGEYLHGEAVAIGLYLATILSVEIGQIQTSNNDRIASILMANMLPTSLVKPLKIKNLIDAMERDKKNRSGKLRFVTMKNVGKAVTTEDIEYTLVEDLWKRAGGI